MTNKKSTRSRSVRVRIVWAIALLTAFLIVFFYGVGVGVYHWPPFSVLKTGKAAIESKSDTHRQLYKSEGTVYTLTTTRLSYFALDKNGNLELQKSLPYRAEGMYRFDRTISPNSTAIVIMDPWVDNPSEHLSQYYGKVIESRIIPLVKRAFTRGHPIIVLTNNPSKVKYSAKIHHELQALVENGKASMLFHQDFDDDGFATYLHSEGIESLIYTGFASNKCVIGRRMGMIPMTHQGFKIFFIPEASAASECADTWHDKSIHKATTTIISQWIAEIINYDEFMEASVGR
jgi:hypothetical protein